MSGIGKRFVIVTASAIALGAMAVSAPVHGTIIDPNFAVCQATTPDACGAHPNIIDGTTGTFNAFVIGGAGAGPLDPFLILVAVPNQSPPTPATGPTFTNSTSGGGLVGTNVSVPTGGIYGSTAPTATGYIGELTSTPVNCDDLYCFANLVNGNSSESFASFTSGDAESNLIGYVPTSFSVYEFAIAPVTGTTGSNLGTSDIYAIDFSNIPLGSFIAAYGIEQYPPPKHGSDTVYDSAFTVSGWVTSSGGPPSSSFAPEPASLALFGFALAALGMFSRKRSTLS